METPVCRPLAGVASGRSLVSPWSAEEVFIFPGDSVPTSASVLSVCPEPGAASNRGFKVDAVLVAELGDAPSRCTDVAGGLSCLKSSRPPLVSRACGPRSVEHRAGAGGVSAPESSSALALLCRLGLKEGTQAAQCLGLYDSVLCAKAL